MEFYDIKEMQEAVIKNTTTQQELRYVLKLMEAAEGQEDFAMKIIDRMLDRIEKK